jgi:hypothetical protein
MPTPLTPEVIASDPVLIHQLLATRGALKIQATTGLRHSGGSVVNVARERYGTTSRTAKGQVEELNELVSQVKHLMPNFRGAAND